MTDVSQTLIQAWQHVIWPARAQQQLMTKKTNNSDIYLLSCFRFFQNMPAHIKKNAQLIIWLTTIPNTTPTFDTKQHKNHNIFDKQLNTYDNVYKQLKNHDTPVWIYYMLIQFHIIYFNFIHVNTGLIKLDIMWLKLIEFTRF